MEPITIVLSIISLVSFLSTGFNWLKNTFSSDASIPVALSVDTQTSRTIIHSPSINDDILKSEYVNFKSQKEISSKSESDNRKLSSTSNSDSILILIVCIFVVLGVMGLIIYKKRNKLKENELKFHRIDSPSSP